MAKKKGIAIGALDSYTEALTTMRGVNQAFGKDLNGLSQKLRSLDRNKVTLRIDTDNASAALEKARNQFDLTGKAADKAALRIATQKYDTVKRNLDLVSTSAGQVEKNMASMTGAIEKSDNRASKSKAGELAQSGLGQMAADTVTNMIGTFATSAFGSKTGNMVSGVVGGAASGALMGSVVPGIGTAIGAVVGGISGAVNAGLQDFKDQDEAFTAVVKDRYDSSMQTQQDALANGTPVAAAREQDQLRFSTLLGGEDEADTFLSQITDFASDNPYDYSQLTALSGALLSYGYKQDEIIPLLTKVGDVGSALGMSADDRNGLVEALADMRSTGTVGQNDLTSFLKRGIDVWKYLAESSGKTEAEVQNLALKGKLSGKDAAEAIANGMGREYSGGMEKQSRTYAGLQENLQEAQNSIDAAMGEGYEDERKQGIQAQMEWLEGSSGKKMEDAYSLIGSWKASLENDKEKSIRDAMKSAMNSDDYITAAAKNDRKEMGRILAEAQAKGENEYMASDEYQDQLEIQKKTIQDIRDDTVLNAMYYDTGKVMAEQFSMGIAAALWENEERNFEPNDSFASSILGGFTTDSQGNVSWSEPAVMKSILEKAKSAFSLKGTGQTNSKSDSSEITLDFPDSGSVDKSLFNQLTDPAVQQKLLQELKRLSKSTGSGSATGLNRVPYNNFPALLHEGETVLTGVEARSGGTLPGVTVTGNTFNVRGESDIDSIASQLFRKMQRAAAVTP